MADSFIGMPSDGAGKKVRTQTRVVGSDTVHESYVINTDATTGNSARVLNAPPAATEYALAVRRVDPARTQRTLHGIGAASATSETLFTLTPVTQFVTGGTGTSIAVTSGKTFRIQSIFAGFRQGTATAAWARVSVRVNPSGAAIVSSPVIASLLLPTWLAATGGGAMIPIPVPDGLEIPVGSGAQLAATHISSATGHFVDVVVQGYEY